MNQAFAVETSKKSSAIDLVVLTTDSVNENAELKLKNQRLHEENARLKIEVFNLRRQQMMAIAPNPMTLSRMLG